MCRFKIISFVITFIVLFYFPGSETSFKFVVSDIVLNSLLLIYLNENLITTALEEWNLKILSASWFVPLFHLFVVVLLLSSCICLCVYLWAEGGEGWQGMGRRWNDILFCQFLVQKILPYNSLKFHAYKMKFSIPVLAASTRCTLNV